MAKKPEASFEERLLTATRVNPPKPGADRQPYLKRVLGYIEQLSDAKWEELAEDIQKWFNAAIKDRDAEKDIRDIPGFKAAAVEDEEEEEAPKSKKKKAVEEEEDEEEEEAPKSKKKKAAAEPEEEEEEEEAPKPKKKAGRKSVDEDSEAEEAGEPEEDEEEAPMAKKKKTTTAAPTKKKVAAEAPTKKKRVASSGGGAPTVIIGLLTKNPGLSRDEIIAKLKDKGIKVSDTTVTTQRQNFRSAVRALHGAGVLSKEFATKVADTL